MEKELKEQLIGFARELAACTWASSSSYESSTNDLIYDAQQRTKAEIGEALLRCLGVPQ